MRAVSGYASAIVTAAVIASASGAYAQDSKLSVPDVTVAALAGRSSRPICAIPGKHTREILISVGIASKRINSRRFRALRRASHSARTVNACKDIGSPLRHSIVGMGHLPAIWRSTWLSKAAENSPSRQIYWF